MALYTEQSDDLATVKRRLRRILLNGPPNSRKTGSLYTAHGPVIVQSFPGEKGTASIPFANFEGMPVKSFVPSTIDVTQPQNWEALWQETRKTTIEILAGKKGPIKTAFFDGLHKAYQVALASVTNGANFTGEEFDPKQYAKTHAIFWQYVDLILNSGVDYIICTCWDGAEKDNPLDDSKESNKRRHIYPDLPGQAAKKIMGEFSMVLFAGQEGVGKAARYYWQTQPQGYVWGAGIKLPRDIVEKVNLPREVEQDWAKLDSTLMAGVDKAWATVHTQPKEATA